MKKVLGYMSIFDVIENFLHDLNNLSLKLYHRYQVGQIAGKSCSEEDFQGIVLESVLQRLQNFDPKMGSIGTFIYTIIRNESSNIKSKAVPLPSSFKKSKSKTSPPTPCN